MITQQYTQGNNEIIIETAESIDDAKKNNFKEGEYSRYYVNGKIVENYLSMIRFMVDAIKENKQSFIPDSELAGKRMEMLQKQNEAMKNQMIKLKSQYQTLNVPEAILMTLDEAIKKIDARGIRITE
jgi:hypothetical protein